MPAISTLVTGLLAALSISLGAAAQSPKTVEAALADFSAKYDALDAAEKNLIEMLSGVDERERAPVENLLNSIANARGYSLTVVALSNAYSNMVDQRDAAYVRRILYPVCSSFAKATDAVGASANKALPRLSAPALIQETTRARDLAAQVGQSQLCKIFPAPKK